MALSDVTAARRFSETRKIPSSGNQRLVRVSDDVDDPDADDQDERTAVAAAAVEVAAAPRADVAPGSRTAAAGNEEDGEGLAGSGEDRGTAGGTISRMMALPENRVVGGLLFFVARCRMSVAGRKACSAQRLAASIRLRSAFIASTAACSGGNALMSSLNTSSPIGPV